MADLHVVPEWSHFNPVKVISGAGALARLPTLVPGDHRILLVTTAGFTRRGITDQVIGLLGHDRVSIYDAVQPNPELDDLDQATARFSRAGIASIVALGGGSVIDAAKVLSVTLPRGVIDPLKKIFRDSKPVEWVKHVPLVAIPTTSGTGAEVTPFATVWDSISHRKHSVVGDLVYPAHALLDPVLTLTLPRDETLYTALDAISHALESLWNKNCTPVTTALAMQALVFASNALPAVLADPSNLGMRKTMQQASLLAGLAISQTRTAIAHSISYPLTSHFGVPHGLACSFTLPVLLGEKLRRVKHESSERRLLMDVLCLLSELNLGERLRQYLSLEQLLSLQPEMLTKGRADNFDGQIENGLENLLVKSVHVDV